MLLYATTTVEVGVLMVAMGWVWLSAFFYLFVSYGQFLNEGMELESNKPYKSLQIYIPERTIQMNQNTTQIPQISSSSTPISTPISTSTSTSTSTLILAEHMGYYNGNKFYQASFKHENEALLLSNFLFDWREMFQEKITAEKTANLGELVIQSCQATLNNIAVLAGLDWSNLKQLAITQYYDRYEQIRCLLTAHELETLLTNKWSSLEKLSLFDNLIGNEGFKLLMETSSLQNVRDLNVGMNKITAFGLYPILETKLLNLSSLDLQFNSIRSTGVKLLVKANLPHLEILKLSHCDIENEGARHLIKGNWPHLSQIQISNNSIGLSGYQTMALNSWPKLQKFNQTVIGCVCCEPAYYSFPGICFDQEAIAMLMFITCSQPTLNVFHQSTLSNSQLSAELLSVFSGRNASRQF